jgi:F0F1-type ATP synthase epsilon subunit
MFEVSIFDQERRLFADSVSQVRLPGIEGELSVGEFHISMISVLKAGRIYVDGKNLSIRKGIALVDRNKLLVLVER